ncbi:MAG: alpha/beta fold hydrolase [Lachnospiraceae bacterium]|nr:alpha/beta fold hydrolase [Lachnospiraceae bacterium]
MKTEILNIEQGSRAVCLDEAHLEELMDGQVEPFLEKIRKWGRMKTERLSMQEAEKMEEAPRDGLYYELYPQENAKGTIVISFGFTESCLKYHELIFYFYAQGYQVAVMDHRGHGKSVREVEDMTIVHIDLFTRYVKDLHRFVQTVVKPMSMKKPLYLYAHSMGGCIGAFYLEQYPKDFKAAVLNAPMLGLKLGCPAWAARIICDMKVAKGEGKERLFVQSEFNPEEPFEHSSASSKARHDYYQKKRRENEDYQTCSASYYWGKEAINAGKFVISPIQAAKVQTPLLLFQAQNDVLVKAAAQEKFISRVKDGRLVLVEGVRHEIYRAPNEVLGPYLEEIFRFYERY